MKVFITGGTSGIGLALARLYAARGATVAVFGLPGSAPSGYSTYLGDVRDREVLIRAVRDFAPDDLDLLIACAGVNHGYECRAWPDFEQERMILEVNLLGVVHAFEAGLSAMRVRRRGRLVAVSSASGCMGVPGNAAYCASKGAVMIYCEAFGAALLGQGIRVTCVAPGFVATPLTAQNPDPMPFLMSADAAAARIARAVDRDRPFQVFPWRTRLAVAALRAMPRGLYRRLFGHAYARRLLKLQGTKD